MEIEEDIDYASIPKAIKDYIKKNFKNKSVTSALKLTLAKGDVFYETLLGTIQLIFDSKGNFMKRNDDVETK